MKWKLLVDWMSNRISHKKNIMRRMTTMMKYFVLLLLTFLPLASASPGRLRRRNPTMNTNNEKTVTVCHKNGKEKEISLEKLMKILAHPVQKDMYDLCHPEHIVQAMTGIEMDEEVNDLAFCVGDAVKYTMPGGTSQVLCNDHTDDLDYQLPVHEPPAPPSRPDDLPEGVEWPLDDEIGERRLAPLDWINWFGYWYMFDYCRPDPTYGMDYATAKAVCQDTDYGYPPTAIAFNGASADAYGPCTLAFADGQASSAKVTGVCSLAAARGYHSNAEAIGYFNIAEVLDSPGGTAVADGWEENVAIVEDSIQGCSAKVKGDFEQPPYNTTARVIRSGNHALASASGTHSSAEVADSDVQSFAVADGVGNIAKVSFNGFANASNGDYNYAHGMNDGWAIADNGYRNLALGNDGSIFGVAHAGNGNNNMAATFQIGNKREKGMHASANAGGLDEGNPRHNCRAYAVDEGTGTRPHAISIGGNSFALAHGSFTLAKASATDSTAKALGSRCKAYALNPGATVIVGASALCLNAESESDDCTVDVSGPPGEEEPGDDNTNWCGMYLPFIPIPCIRWCSVVSEASC